MKTLALLAAAGSLSGCVAYSVPYEGVPYGDPYHGYYGGSGPYVVQPPPVVYGRPGYYHRGAPGPGRRDRDRDGIPNRWDRDRDGDGVPNRQDARPNNPRRY